MTSRDQGRIATPMVVVGHERSRVGGPRIALPTAYPGKVAPWSVDGIYGHPSALWDVVSHDCSRTNYASCTYSNPAQYQCLGCDPDPTLYLYRPVIVCEVR